MRRFVHIVASVGVGILASACVTPGTQITAPIATESAQAGTTVKHGGTPVKLAKGHLAVNEAMPTVALTDDAWGEFAFKADGRVKLVSIVPSIDTKVCEEQTHILSETEMLNPKVERITISRDLPAAQKRFATEASLTNVKYLSDYKSGSFGKASGLLMEESGLLARAVAVVDGEGKVRYLQVVPDVTNLPDMARAIEEANQLIK
jgi:thioredoxin-dependent peroxiredoxin